MTASIEMISENVVLSESQVSARFTRRLVNSDLHQVSKPHSVAHWINMAEESVNQQAWYSLTANSL